MCNGIVGSVAHMLGMHDRLFARCFCRYSGNIASDISYIKSTAGADNCPGCAFYSLFLCLFLCIIVETNACLAAELAGSDHLAQEYVCSVLGITVFCVENVHDRKDNVQTDQVT